MRIISEFKDYYDGFMRYDTERNLLYIRKTVENYKYFKQIHFEGFSPYGERFRYVRNNGVSSFSANPIAVGFCGVLYTGIKFHKNFNTPTKEKEREFLFTTTQIKKFFSNLNMEYDSCYEKVLTTEIKDKKIDHLLKTVPIFYLELSYHCLCTLHPKLSETGFPSVIPPHQAYANLTNWFSNKAVEMKPIPEISDEMKAQAHGFNKYSFRKYKNV